MADGKQYANHRKDRFYNVFGFKEDKVERRIALYANRDGTNYTLPRASRGSARHVFLVYLLIGS